MLASLTTPPCLPSFSRSIRRYTRNRVCFVGIDVGIDQVNVATMGPNPETISSGTPAWGWLSQSEFQLPVDPYGSPPRNWVELVLECLDDCLPRCVDGDQNCAVLSLPMPWIHYQTTSESDIAASRQACDEMFSASIFHCNAHVTQWPLVRGSDKYMIAAVAEAAACRIADSIARIGYHVRAILPHGVALLQAAPKLTSLTPAAVLLLEQAGGLVAVRNEMGCGLCRNLPASAMPVSESPLLAEIDPWLGEIAMEVKATLRYAARLSGQADATSSPILIGGRAGLIPGVDARLADLLGRPVAVWRYAGRTRPRRHSSIHHSIQSDAATAVSLSLACCGLQSVEADGRRTR